jgi:MFS family permease
VATRLAGMNLAEPAYQFRPEDRPVMPGGPFAPPHPALRRLGYGAIGLLAAVAATFSNALVNVDAASLAGSLGLYVAQAVLLPTIFFAMNASTNLMLVKARIQFGIPRTTQALLAVYIVAGLAQFLFAGFVPALVVRAASGMAAAALITLSVFYLLQVFPPKARPAALVIGVGLVQLGTPLARLIPVEMLTLGSWRSVHLIEIGLAAAILATTLALPLPPSERSPALEPLDFLSVALIVPAITLVCAVLGAGRLLWWHDTPWLGWALVAAVVLFATAVLIELHRARPLLQIEWITSLDILRFAAVALLVRLALAEQTYGAVGLLTSGGLINDQLHTLFAIVAVAMVLGIVAAVATLSPQSVPYQVMIAALLIAWAGWLDSGATNITRPEQLYFSQALLGFGTTLFIGPALAFGFLRVLSRGPDSVVSMLVVFSVTQNVGALAGPALLGSYQIASTHAHAAALSEHLLGADPQVAARLQAEGPAALAQAMTREANVLAFNDVFTLVAALAAATALFIACVLATNALRRVLK